MKTCQRCGYEWEPKRINPKSCPSCKSYKWNLAREKPKTTGNPGKEDEKHWTDNEEVA